VQIATTDVAKPKARFTSYLRTTTRTGAAVWRLGVAAVLLLVWEAAAFLTGSIWLSSPGLVGARLADWLRGSLYIHLGTTLEEIAVGVAIGTGSGAVLGLLLGRAPALATLLRPLIVALYNLPLLALAPLFIMLFGLGFLPAVVLVSVVVFFLVFFNTFSGAEAVDDDVIRSLQIMGANRIEVFRKVIGPASVVWIISGLKVALPYSLAAATTGEMLAGGNGLGGVLTSAAQQFDMAAMYAALVVLMIVGMLLNTAATGLETWLLRWRHAAD
jgi:NitT/TauT family transport system permease protein